MWGLMRRLTDELGLPRPWLRLPFPSADAAARLSEPAVLALQRLRLLRRDFEPKLSRYAVAAIGRTTVLDVSAARQALGYAPVTSTQETLSEVAAYLARDSASRLHLLQPPSPWPCR